jgi:hypothetical protein
MMKRQYTLMRRTNPKTDNFIPFDKETGQLHECDAVQQ